MEILRAAGFPILGEAFPAEWGERIGELNPNGFWESSFRDGISWATNPDPTSGAYASPEQLRGIVGKIFCPGLLRTDLAFIERVVVTLRPWRAYVASARRLHEMELGEKGAKILPFRPRDMALDWWASNFGVVRNAALRGYPTTWVGYQELIAQPERSVRRVLDFFGVEDAKGWEKVDPKQRHYVDPEVPEVEPELAARLDDLYATLSTHGFVPEADVPRLNAAQAAISVEFAGLAERQREAVDARRRLGRDRIAGRRDEPAKADE